MGGGDGESTFRMALKLPCYLWQYWCGLRKVREKQMRKLISIMVLFVGALMLPYASKADSITATATYSNSTSSTLFSAPGNTITFTFNLPAHLNVFLTELSVPISVSFQGNTIAETALVFLHTNDDSGLFDLFFLAGFHSWHSLVRKSLMPTATSFRVVIQSIQRRARSTKTSGWEATAHSHLGQLS